jgi:polysaccharide biosynthesis transport protein
VSTDAQQAVTLRHYLQILWRRKWIIVQAVVIIPLLVVGVSLTQPKRYAATARIMTASQATVVSAATGSNLTWQNVDERELQTLATFVATPEIASAAVKQLGWPMAPGDALGSITATADPNASVIAVTATNADPEKAAALANAFATEFVAWRQQTQRGSIDEAIKLVDDQIQTTPKKTLSFSALVDRRSQLEVIKALVTGDVVVGESAQVPGAPASPKPLRNGALAFAGALIVGIGLAFLRESLDVSIHTVDEISAAIDMPLLGTIPQFKDGERGAGHMITLEDPRSPAAESYRFLRTNLEFVDFGRDAKTILVTSPQPAQGKSTTIANLAVTLLRAGKKVAVVEGDLRRPSLHRFFKVRNSLGITTVVSSATTLEEAMHTLTYTEAQPKGSERVPQGSAGLPASGAIGELRLRVLTSGPIPPNPGEIVTSDQFSAVLAELREGHDYVLVDAPPMFVVGDAAALAGKVDGVIIVLRFAQTSTHTLTGVTEFAKRVPARTLGVVVTGAPPRARGRSYRYDAYYE